MGPAAAANCLAVLHQDPCLLGPTCLRLQAQDSLDAAVAGYGVAGEELAELHRRLAAAARAQLLAHAREAANTALSRVKDRWAREGSGLGAAALLLLPPLVSRAVRPSKLPSWLTSHWLVLAPRFAEVFQRDEQGMPRSWAPSVDVPAVAREARRAAALLLSQLAAVRLAPLRKGKAAAQGRPWHVGAWLSGRAVALCWAAGGWSLAHACAGRAALASSAAAPYSGRRMRAGPDPIEAALLALAKDPPARDGPGLPAPSSEFDLLSATEWPEGAVAGTEDVLLTPPQCRATWRQFTAESTLAVQQVGDGGGRRDRLPIGWAAA